MNRPVRPRLDTVVVCLVSLAGVASARAPSSASDSAPVAIVPFSGLHGDEPQAAVARVLGARAAVVPADAIAKLKPYVVVTGAVEKKDGLKLTVRVLDERGAEAGHLEVPIAGGRHLSPEQLRKLGADVDALVTQALAAPVPVEPVPPTPPPEEPAKQDTDTEKVPLNGVPVAKPAAQQHPARRSWFQFRFSDVPRPSYYPFVIVRVGAVVSSRSLSFDPIQRPVFHGGTGGGVHGEVELYPVAFTHAIKRGIFAGLGGWFAFDKPFWPTTTFDGTPNAYDTDELRVEGGARWRFVVRKLAPVVELTVFGGAGLHTFTIAKTNVLSPTTGKPLDAGPPDARYVYGTVGIEARATIWRGRFAPFVRIGYEYVPDAGPTENLDEYGLSSTHGFQLRGGLDARVWRRLSVGAAAYWEWLDLAFQNNVPTARRAGSAVDQYVGAVFTVGYAL